MFHILFTFYSHFFHIFLSICLKNPKFAALGEKLVINRFLVEKSHFLTKHFRDFFSKALPERRRRLPQPGASRRAAKLPSRHRAAFSYMANVLTTSTTGIPAQMFMLFLRYPLLFILPPNLLAITDYDYVDVW